MFCQQEPSIAVHSGITSTGEADTGGLLGFLAGQLSPINKFKANARPCVIKHVKGVLRSKQCPRLTSALHTYAHTGLHEVRVLDLLCLDDDLAVVLCLCPLALQITHVQSGPHCASPLSVILGAITSHLLSGPSFCLVSLCVF